MHRVHGARRMPILTCSLALVAAIATRPGLVRADSSSELIDPTDHSFDVSHSPLGFDMCMDFAGSKDPFAFYFRLGAAGR